MTKFEGKGTLSVTIATRHYLASQLMWSALHQARRCEEIEAERPDLRSAAAYEHTSLAIGCALAAVSALEALVNEVYADAADNSPNRMNELPPRAIKQLADYWSEAMRRESMIEKAKFALRAVAGTTSALPGMHWQHVNHLVDARNALVHFYPETVSSSSASRLEAQMTTYFKRNGLTAAGNPWFYSGMLGAGFARWAATTAHEFALAWVDAMKLTPTMRTDLAAMPAP